MQEPISVTVDMPGVFDSDFSGSGVGQGIVDLERSGYDGAPMLYEAYRGARKISGGKGYRLRLTLSGEPLAVEDALYCLWHHADTYVYANSDEPEMRTARAASITMRDRTRAVAVAAGLDVSDWR